MNIYLDAFLPRGSVFDLGGTTFTADATSRTIDHGGLYQWTSPPVSPGSTART